MEKQLNVLITSGGIGVKIDDIRRITNDSKGATGAFIAEEFLEQGANVYFVCAKGSRQPFLQHLRLDPKKPEQDEIARICKTRERYLKNEARLHCYPVEEFNDYLKTVEDIIASNKMGVVILAAAVADYGIMPQTGKISSDKDTLELVMTKNPKVISLIKQWDPNIFLVGFKLLTGPCMTQEMIDAAYRQGINNHSNLTVFNVISGGDLDNRCTVFITPEKGITAVRMKDIAPKLAGVVNQRFSRHHFHTNLRVVDHLDAALGDNIDIFTKVVKDLWRFNLFEPYFLGEDDCHFGFVAKRVAGNTFLTTARASDKKNPTEKDIVYVTGADWSKNLLQVVSTGKKASLNASLPAKIFEERPDIDWIVHAHVFLGLENRTSFDPAPGTIEEINEVLGRLDSGEVTLEIPQHGIIVLGKSTDAIKDCLRCEPAYTKFADFYDLIYGRFQKSPGFINFVAENLERDKTILDLAVGTGDVSYQLSRAGFKNISMADMNMPMIKEAMIKNPGFPVYHTSMEELAIDRTFDAILMRQAVNYLGRDSLLPAFRKMWEHLNDGGKLIFNAPLFSGDSTYGDREESYAINEWNISVYEMNLLEGRMLTHTQRCSLMNSKTGEVKKIYDLNTFTMYTREEFEEALRLAGFKQIEFVIKNSKTLYCLCTK